MLDRTEEESKEVEDANEQVSEMPSQDGEEEIIDEEEETASTDYVVTDDLEEDFAVDSEQEDDLIEDSLKGANTPIDEVDDQEDDSEEYEEDEEDDHSHIQSSANSIHDLTSSGNSGEKDIASFGKNNNTVSGSYISDSFNFGSRGDLSFSCSNCQSTVKSKEYGKIECQFCGATNYRYNLNENIHVTEFRTLSHSPDDNYQFKKLLSKISNALIGKLYYRAYKLCTEASEIAPGESVVWELFAQAEYFARTRGQIRPKQGYTPHDEIINLVRTHLKRAKFHAAEDDYTGSEVVAGEIAEDITNNTKSKLGQYRRKKKKRTNEKMYSKVDLRECCKLLPQFKSAYKLTGNNFHLKAYVEELSKEYKWMIVKLDESLVSMPNVPKKFNPVRERQYLIEMIQHSEPDYAPPEILKERLSFDFSQPVDPPAETGEIEGLIFHDEE